MTEPTYVFELSGPIKPKARPRCTCRRGRGHAYNPEAYQTWKANAISQLKREALAMGLREKISHPVRYTCWFFGRHDRGKDYIDNAPGAIADALVEAGLWAGDNGTNGPAASYELFWSKAAPTTWIALAPRISTAPAEAIAEAQEQAEELWKLVRTA